MRDGLEFATPGTLAERAELARLCVERLGLTVPVLLDSLENTAGTAYNGWPERLYVISVDGRIAYHGGKGPYGFNTEEWERFLSG